MSDVLERLESLYQRAISPKYSPLPEEEIIIAAQKIVQQHATLPMVFFKDQKHRVLTTRRIYVDIFDENASRGGHLDRKPVIIKVLQGLIFEATVLHENDIGEFMQLLTIMRLDRNYVFLGGNAIYRQLQKLYRLVFHYEENNFMEGSIWETLLKIRDSVGDDFKRQNRIKLTATEDEMEKILFFRRPFYDNFHVYVKDQTAIEIERSILQALTYGSTTIRERDREMFERKMKIFFDNHIYSVRYITNNYSNLL